MRIPPIAWLVLAGYLLFLQPGAYLNDETLQVAGLDVLHRGGYVLHGDYSPGIWTLQDGLRHGSLPINSESAPIGSTMLNVLALPFVFLLEVLDQLIGLRVALAAITLGALSYAAWHYKKWDPRILASGALAILAPTFLLRATPADPFALMAAMQLVNIIAMTVAAVLLGRVVAPQYGERTATYVTILFAFGTPAFFWAMHLKYHSLAIALTAMAIWTFRNGIQSTPKQWAATGAIAGLAVWNQLPHGALLIGGWGLFALFSKHAIGPRLKSYAAAAAGLMLGLLPEIMERIAISNMQLNARFVPIDAGTGAVSTEVQDQIAKEVSRGFLSQTIFAQPQATLSAYWEVFAWPQLEHLRSALPMLALMPILWYWRPKGIAKWGAWHLAFMIAIMGTGVLSHGGGLDPRQATTLWPFIVLGLAPMLATVPTWSKRVNAIALVPALYALMLVPLFLIRKIRGIETIQLGYSAEFLVPLKFIGLGLSAVACAYVLRGKRNSHFIWAAFTFSILVQWVMVMGPANVPNWKYNAPMIWPMQLLSEAFQWFSYSY